MVEQVVGLRFVVEGEREATAKLKTFQHQQDKVTNSVKTGASIAKRLENDIKSLNSSLDKGTIGQKAFDSAIVQIIRSYKMLNEGVRGNQMSIQKATSDVYKMVNAIKSEEQAREKLLDTRRRAETAFALAMQRHNEEQRALQQEQAERLRLEAMYDRNAVAARVYQNAVANLNRAEQLGVITADQKAKELLQLEAAYQRAGTSANRTNTFINQFGEGARVAGIKTNRFGLYAQQVGYQVGDFFVQIQSGTNAFVAFGQQATQLAGLLPGLAGAIVGISISVATMFLSAWSRTSAALDDTAESIKNLDSELDSLDGTIRNWLQTKKAASLGVTVEELFGIQGVEQAEKSVEIAKAELDRLLEAYGADINEIEKEALRGITGYDEAVSKLEKSQNRLTQIRAKIEEEKQVSFEERTLSLENENRILERTLRYGKDSVEVQKELNVQARARLITEMMAEGQSTDRILDALRLLKIQQDLTAEIESGGDGVKQTNKELEEQLKLEEKISEEAAKRNQSFRERTLSLENENRILERTLKYGKDSAEVQKELNSQAQARLVTEMMAEKQSPDRIVAALKLLRIQQDLNAEIESGAEEDKVREDLEKSRLKSIELYYDNLEKAVNLEKENADAVTEIIKNRDAAVATLEGEIALNQEILKYGKDSEQVAIMKANNERAAFMEQAKQQGILGNNLKIVMALYDQNVKVSNEVEAASEKAKEFAEALKEASSAMASLSGFSANLDRELAVATAKVEALRQGADATIAGNIAGMRADLERRMGEAVAAGVDRGIVERQFGGERARISQLEALRQEEKRLGERGKGGAGGAGGAAQGDYLSQLQKEAELKLRLIGLTDEQRRYEEIAAELSERGLPVEEQRIQAIIATEQALQQATNAEERRQEIMQAVTGNIETALMGLVEGTSSVEDAFKSMMRNIILEVYRQQVAKPFADAIGSFFFANGAAFQGGNVVPFANGGVVGGPTTFPMSGGRTGLMGEAGPEAIMPLKRGKDGKLGVVAEGGGAITQNLVFNISANGDDSVKRIVQQQIPRIAEATKAAVVDAKRRGGAYGKAFA